MKKVSTYQTTDNALFTDKKKAQAHEIQIIVVGIVENDQDIDSVEKAVLEILNQ